MSEGFFLPPQPWMTEAATRAVMAALAPGGDARFVGGSVRDALCGSRRIGDIDIATPAAPERVMDLLAAAGIRAIPTGLAHGTVTAVIGTAHFEITTLRRDVKTYGRHADVAFTDDWREDAARRDFTINAMSLTPEGEVFDYFGGRDDLAAGRVRFVGLEKEGATVIDRAEEVRDQYIRKLSAHREGLKALGASVGWSFGLHHTDHAPQPALAALHNAITGYRR